MSTNKTRAYEKGILITAATLAFVGSAVIAIVFPVQEATALTTYDVAKMGENFRVQQSELCHIVYGPRLQRDERVLLF